MTATTITQRKELLNTQIKDMRAQLINVGLQYGFTNAATIQISQKLDKLINEYLRLDATLTQPKNQTNYYN
ncbi:aspartyl-phosphate phosphatase Spo0E family protein [Calidifontibacillus oryziterrae]|uniref:aspartyl-phosphate phosphatase Spo0E family protein n=1 Tax=Calidifontibacillus oryziterrae TaxID=1191699 RepID=UPI0002FD7033|nr:aspartyl-phosphate phosphatase Spo0E family protein [Calidifontibacillus oryziterrae]